MKQLAFRRGRRYWKARCNVSTKPRLLQADIVFRQRREFSAQVLGSFHLEGVFINLRPHQAEFLFPHGDPIQFHAQAHPFSMFCPGIPASGFVRRVVLSSTGRSKKSSAVSRQATEDY